MNFIVREGDKLCTPGLTHCHTVKEIGPDVIVVQFNGKRQKVKRRAMYAAMAAGALMVLDRA